MIYDAIWSCDSVSCFYLAPSSTFLGLVTFPSVRALIANWWSSRSSLRSSLKLCTAYTTLMPSAISLCSSLSAALFPSYRTPRSLSASYVSPFRMLYHSLLNVEQFSSALTICILMRLILALAPVLSSYMYCCTSCESSPKSGSSWPPSPPGTLFGLFIWFLGFLTTLYPFDFSALYLFMLDFTFLEPTCFSTVSETS